MKSSAVEKQENQDFKWTPQRKAIITAIKNSNKKHLSAEEIYLIAKKILPKIGLATVYRALELFCEKGILQKLNLPNQPIKYEILKDDSNSHCHYVCLGCGKIYEVPIQKELILSENENLKDFKIVNSSCWYFGYCKNCKDKVNKKNKGKGVTNETK
ncbi:Fur family transcriptional regulator [Thermovenabulum gondwanense]|uniref:Ferric uptake regulation protein n=1 Tax=Thermovenabulum gondwanense TaxID=520767 RepID=A0A162MZ48_9FIRM|nr:transcriptional repressor [Thermovenabulum gondwanense]KYO68585.1 Ferric uptake regulation protein [Thermovenabulum gondwanense]